MSTEHIKKWAINLLPVLLLAGIVFACFYRTLGSYFVADDFGQITYASGICKGDWQSLLANFTGNYMQIPVMKIYRPCLLLSFVLDYALWHTNPIGYFLTDILWLAAAAVMLYYLLRELTGKWSNKRSIVFALLSASLFAAYPLHCESISFVSGRDNVISAFFYLLTLWCFVKYSKTQNKNLLIVGIISFWPVLLSKEMAIGLPVVLTGIIYFLPDLFAPEANSYSIKQRFILAIKKSLPLWINTVIYFVIRFLALGTIIGGYTGNIGAGLNANSLARWESIDTFVRIVYPLNSAIFGNLGSYYAAILSVIYAVLLTLAAIRLLTGKYSADLFGLVVLWVFTTVAPIYQLWGLGDNLEGARFFFFLSMPLSIILPLLIFEPSNKNNASAEDKKIIVFGAIVFVALIALNINITYNNNIAWTHAGKQSKACLLESQRLARSLPTDKKLAIIGLPKEENGAHIIYNGSTFNVMMTPPFSPDNYTQKFITFDPIFYGNPWLINPSRLRTVLSSANVAGLFAWNMQTLHFEHLPIPAHNILARTSVPAPIRFKPIETPTAVVTSNQGIIYHIVHQPYIKDQGLFAASSIFNPYLYDFLELTLQTTFPKEMMFVFWKGNAAKALDYCEPQHTIQQFISGATSPKTIRIKLSDHWHWYTQGNINRLQLEFIPGESVKVSNMQLVCDQALAPAITIVDAKPDNVGAYLIGPNGLTLNYNAATITNCASVKIEISKPNYFFEELSSEDERNAVMKTITAPARRGQLHISDKLFGQSAYYQLRAYCLNKVDNSIGEKSDPITIKY